MAQDPEAHAAAVFTYKSRSTIARDSGTQSWRLNANKIGTFNYVIMARNRTGTVDTPEDDRPHGSAFFLGRLLDIVPATDPDSVEGKHPFRRWLFRLSEVAPLDIERFWTFGRWTTIVRPLAEFGIDPSRHVFRPLSDYLDQDEPGAHAPPPVPLAPQALVERARRSVSEIIAEHRAGMSHEIGVPEDRIDISIRF